ncbi:MAG TPA: TIGR04190 family B12-binding domain/radical SAM domain protein, partial [Coriobacteriia bacterium]|nr:TIGR04190 family B12-binding domain/radical SAM domain protein [Coriobacteriia bacterium]
MSRVDLVLLHAPSVYDFRERSIMFGPVSDMVPSTPVFEMYPLGFTTMAEYMERHGLKVRIVNLAVLMLNRPGFDVERAIREMDPVAFGIDLHWLPHAHGSVEIAKICKKHHPDTPVIFGGLSASFFHEELAGYPWVDYVVRGDSTEEPMTRLLFALKAKGRVDDIPNLTYATSCGSLHSTPFEWMPDDMNDISLDYSFNMRAVIRYRDMMGFVPFRDWLQYPVCASLTCRGCTHNCVTCGGSAYSFRTHYGRRKVAFRDPELLVRDIEHIQKYIPGPIFVLNDFMQAGPDYTEAFIRGLQKIRLRNPIGFEFFKPPSEEFYRFLNEHLDDYSVEVSIESHDDSVRTAFGKHHYTTEQVEESVRAALRHGCSRFDLYMMTGIPGQTAASVLETPAYVESLYAKVDNDKRLLCFSSPMAPFLDPGSMAYDDPERYGYTRLADTLEEHRQLLVQPSWKYIMNYESRTLSKDELVDTMYEVGLRLNRLKGRLGLIEPEVASRTEDRILRAREAMERIDAVMREPDAAVREREFNGLKKDIDRLSESTVCEKTELNWPRYVHPRHVYHVFVLWARENLANLFGSRKRFVPRTRPAC